LTGKSLETSRPAVEVQVNCWSRHSSLGQKKERTPSSSSTLLDGAQNTIICVRI